RARRDPAPGGDRYEGFREDDELRSALRGLRDRGPLAFEGHCGTEGLPWPALGAARTSDRPPCAICAAPLALPRGGSSEIPTRWPYRLQAAAARFQEWAGRPSPASAAAFLPSFVS